MWRMKHLPFLGLGLETMISPVCLFIIFSRIVDTPKGMYLIYSKCIEKFTFPSELVIMNSNFQHNDTNIFSEIMRAIYVRSF